LTIRTSLLAAALAAIAPSGHAQEAASPIAGIAFLVGDWVAGQSVVSDTGGTAKGRSTITREAGGTVLLRRDHTDLFDAAGKPAGGFDQVMMIYPEGATLHADYVDGTHVIHYVSADIVAGSQVTFTSAAAANTPTYRLHYQRIDRDTLTVVFAMAPPASADFHPIASGSITRVH
jgi:hypothetical protein